MGERGSSAPIEAQHRSKRALTRETPAPPSFNSTHEICGLGKIQEIRTLDAGRGYEAGTQGKGTFAMEFAKYARTPRDVQEEVVAARRKELAARK